MRTDFARRATRCGLAAVVAVAALATAACSTSSSGQVASTASSSGRTKTIQVVAAENFWGSIAAQLGGSHVKVTSIIDNPNADPHNYEPTAEDARAVAGADYVIVNGIGYDVWAPRLLSAGRGGARIELNVGELVGIETGGNPHRWYSPADVHKVIEKITADYQQVDPADAAYFEQQKNTFVTETLAPYNKLISHLAARYAGTPIGASESIVSPLAEGLGLKMLTPATFLNAISEGTDPTATDKAIIDQQIAGKQIKIYVYNTQNATQDVQAQVAAAKAKGIPVATVTETPTPATAPFQTWQVRQLQSIERALAMATRN